MSERKIEGMFITETGERYFIIDGKKYTQEELKKILKERETE